MRECASGERSVSGRLAQRTGLAGGRHAAGPSGIAHQHDPDRPAPARSPTSPQREHSTRAHRCDLRPHSAGGRDVERSSRSEFQFHSRADSLPGARSARVNRLRRRRPSRWSASRPPQRRVGFHYDNYSHGDAFGRCGFGRQRHRESAAGVYTYSPRSNPEASLRCDRTRVRPRQTMRTFVTPWRDALERNSMLFSRNGQSARRTAPRTASATTTRRTPCA